MPYTVLDCERRSLERVRSIKLRQPKCRRFHRENVSAQDIYQFAIGICVANCQLEGFLGNEWHRYYKAGANTGRASGILIPMPQQSIKTRYRLPNRKRCTSRWIS